MTPGPRTHRTASLRVAIPDLPENMRAGIREILSVTSELRGNGHAKALMWQVTTEADRAGMVLLLKVEPYAEGLTLEQLLKFYSGFGFVQIQDEPVLMARQPQSTQIARMH